MIFQGQLIIKNEDEVKNIVSLKYALENFKGLKRELFIKYAYPISDELFVTWSKEAKDWRPIIHSCEPNMWFDKECDNIYARRDIIEGELLTMDYCTFLIQMEGLSDGFNCICSEKSCRKTIKLDDCFRKELKEKYKGHFSIYLTKKLI